MFRYQLCAILYYANHAIYVYFMLKKEVSTTSKEYTEHEAQCDPSARHSMTKIHVKCSDHHLFCLQG